MRCAWGVHMPACMRARAWVVGGLVSSWVHVWVSCKMCVGMRALLATTQLRVPYWLHMRSRMRPADQHTFAHASWGGCCRRRGPTL